VGESDGDILGESVSASVGDDEKHIPLHQAEPQKLTFSSVLLFKSLDRF
jgi:hypothetical protein